MADSGDTLDIPVTEGHGKGMGLGAVISEKLAESIQHMDLLNVLQKMVANTPEDEESEEIRDKLRGVLEQFKDLTDDDKAAFTKQIKDGLANKLIMKMKDSAVLDNLEDTLKQAIVSKLYLVGFGFVLLMVLIVFFGYKLYKSIKDKEKKREEKKKAKQMKKKK